MESKQSTQQFLNFLDQIIEEGVFGNIQQESVYKSLYEYLGKAAGKELGQQVFKFAKLHKIKMRQQLVNQGGYNGLVMCYPVEFLQEYFMLREKYKQYKQYFE